MDVDAALPRSSRLHTIHLLGWMFGCGVVLGFFRVFNRPATPAFADLLRELAFGLAYGTAAS